MQTTHGSRHRHHSTTSQTTCISLKTGTTAVLLCTHSQRHNPPGGSSSRGLEGSQSTNKALPSVWRLLTLSRKKRRKSDRQLHPGADLTMGLALSGLTGKKESKAVREYHLGQDHTKRLGQLEALGRTNGMKGQQWLPGSHTSVLGLRLVWDNHSQHLKINRVPM